MVIEVVHVRGFVHVVEVVHVMEVMHVLAFTLSDFHDSTPLLLIQ